MDRHTGRASQVWWEYIGPRDGAGAGVRPLANVPSWSGCVLAPASKCTARSAEWRRSTEGRAAECCFPASPPACYNSHRYVL
eukprot:6656730-Pyramimonas_sp.AAC.1